jgi:3D (Asp-Asp-Asp) domain-containing protein
MYFKKISLPLLITLVIIAAAVVTTSAQDEEATRGSFLSTRVSASAGAGKTNTNSGTSTTRRSRRRKSVVRPANTSNRNTSPTRANTNTSNAGVTMRAVDTSPIGLGYTLYMRDSNGEAMRVDPDRTFRTGDRVRLFMETNTDAYIYIFNSTDNGDPVMIYPDAQLDDAGNYVEAHVPTEIPASTASEERLRWFTFDDKPGIEHVYIVVTREPLPAIPIEDDLVSYCRTNSCPWRPAPNVWAQVRAALNGRVQVVKARTYGQTQTSGEREATTRGLGLDQSSPPPSVIRMNVSSNTGLLVTGIDLSHK